MTVADALQADLDPYVNEAQALLAPLWRQPSVSGQNLGIAERATLTASLLRAAGFRTQRLDAEAAPPAI
jgi:hypothetical protein